MTVQHAPGSVSVLDIEGSVAWEWLATCRTCDLVHGYRTETPGKSYMTWSAVDGHTYRPRLPRLTLDALMIEHRMVVGDVVDQSGDGAPRQLDEGR